MVRIVTAVLWRVKFNNPNCIIDYIAWCICKRLASLHRLSGIPLCYPTTCSCISQTVSILSGFWLQFVYFSHAFNSLNTFNISRVKAVSTLYKASYPGPQNKYIWFPSCDIPTPRKTFWVWRWVPLEETLLPALNLQSHIFRRHRFLCRHWVSLSLPQHVILQLSYLTETFVTWFVFQSFGQNWKHTK